MILTVHRWFANKSCPGTWLYSRLGTLADEVTAKLGGETKKDVIYRVQVGAFTVKQNAEAFLKEVRAKGFENAFITKVELEPEFKPYEVTVTAKIGLIVRDGPGTSYIGSGSLEYGDIVTVLEENNGWGKLANGWICLDYTRKN